MGLCFFALSASVQANLYDQSKEIGIIRSLGFKSNRIILLYCYESFILVFASTCLGILTGTLTAFCTVVQYTTFIGVPCAFYFPWQLMECVSVGAVVCAMASTIGPARALVKGKSIAEILKTA